MAIKGFLLKQCEIGDKCSLTPPADMVLQGRGNNKDEHLSSKAYRNATDLIRKVSLTRLLK